MSGEDIERRVTARHEFLRANGWDQAEITALAADASFRRYFRLKNAGNGCMLMDAPPPQEDVGPFINVARHLQRLGLQAPEIIAQDRKQGFVLLEDFGDNTFTRLLAAGEDEADLYQMALDLLLVLHQDARACDVDVPAYDDNVLLREAMLLPEWYFPALTGKPCPDSAVDEYRDAWKSCFTPLHSAEPTLVLRDFHVDNLMRLDEGESIDRCGVLDFQDALIGSAAYDLMSLLEDARRDVSSDLQQALLERYLQQRPDLDVRHFMSCYRILGAQRHAKVAGIFVRLCKRDGKQHYLLHIPRVVGLLKKHLQADELAPVKAWFDRWLPNFEQSLKVSG